MLLPIFSISFGLILDNAVNPTANPPILLNNKVLSVSNAFKIVLSPLKFYIVSFSNLMELISVTNALTDVDILLISLGLILAIADNPLAKSDI